MRHLPEARVRVRSTGTGRDTSHPHKVHSLLVRVNEELLERKAAAPVYKSDINDRVGSAALTTRQPSIRKIWL
jgi:hypothetical protein